MADTTTKLLLQRSNQQRAEWWSIGSYRWFWKGKSWPYKNHEALHHLCQRRNPKSPICRRWGKSWRNSLGLWCAYLESILELRMSDLIEADMTLTQVHQLIQVATEHSDAKLKQDPPQWNSQQRAEWRTARNNWRFWARPHTCWRRDTESSSLCRRKWEKSKKPCGIIVSRALNQF